MSEQISITLIPENEIFSFPKGITLEELKEKVITSPSYIITGALVNNEIKDLVYKLNEDSTVQFLDLSHSEGLRIYVNSLSFLLLISSRRVFPGEPLHILHSLDRGLFCVLKNMYPIKKQKLMELEESMKEIVEDDLNFKGKIIDVEDATKLFKNQGSYDKVKLLEYYQHKKVPVYRCDGISNTFYGPLVPSTGYLRQFELTYYPPGFILRFPDIFSPDKLPEHTNQRKLARIFYEYQKWVSLLGVDTLSALNNFIRRGEIDEIIRISEALQEKKIAKMADMITQYKDQLKIILIAGPSASGKTTFAKRLATQLRVNGLKPIPISVDDYFIDVEDIPFDETGERNFETIEVVDLELLNDHLISLLYGEEIELPSFDFASGKRTKSGRKIKISDEHLLIMEGIHCLNDRLTEAVPQSNKYKIYVSALCQLNLDDHNRVSP
ncbi:MAG TPA: nucleoside kinase, partial [Candidatus Eremiobacteraeota bacterium]|nr:nucleoside kinase [Candidatus Eremiobacteraeota bacterium]